MAAVNLTRSYFSPSLRASSDPSVALLCTTDPRDEMMLAAALHYSNLGEGV